MTILCEFGNKHMTISLQLTNEQHYLFVSE